MSGKCTRCDGVGELRYAGECPDCHGTGLMPPPEGGAQTPAFDGEALEFVGDLRDEGTRVIVPIGEEVA